MITYLSKSCSFGLICMSFVNVYQFVFVRFFSFFWGGCGAGLGEGIWYLIVSVPDHWLSISFEFTATGIVPCGGRKTSARTSSVVKIIFYCCPLRSENIFWGFKILCLIYSYRWSSLLIRLFIQTFLIPMSLLFYCFIKIRNFKMFSLASGDTDEVWVAETSKYGSGWLVGCFGFNGPLRQYFSLYRAVSQREGEREEKG